ncbi:MAG: transposase, partial [Methylococcales bacterium]|nr:transposase [Methylococcales bacterium]
MNKKRPYKTYPKEFKEEAVTLVTEQGYSVSEAAKSVGVKDKLIYNWKKKIE